MITEYLALAALAVTVGSAAIEAFFLFRKDGVADAASPWLLSAAAALLFALTIIRSLDIGFAALTGTYECLVFYAGVMAAIAAVYRFQRRLPRIPAVEFGLSTMAAILLILASSPLAPKAELAPIPAIRSFWLVLHVSLAIVGEAFFAAAFVAGLASLITRDDRKRLDFDRITYAAIAVGYPVFTAGALVFGAIWAERAWGSWWSWDPKETWAAVTWLVYTLYLHLRLVRGRKDRLPALVAVLGFLAALFTLFGVNFLLKGLHSYA